MKNGWQVRKIGDICTLATGGTPSRSRPEYFGGEIKWLVSGDIHQGEIFDCEGRITEAGMKNSNAKILPINSVMIALNGQGKTRGTVAVLRTPSTCNQSMVSISPNESSGLMAEFLYANLHGRYDEIRRVTSDDDKDRRGLNMGLIRNIEIPIAPLPEQKRIVRTLNKAFESMATAKGNAETNLQRARALFESHLQSVFTRSNDEVCISDLATDITDGDHSPPPKAPTGVPFITISDIVKRTREIDFSNTFMVPTGYFRNLKSNKKPRLGDVLYTVTGTFGIPVLVSEQRDFCFQRHIGIIRPKTTTDSAWLAYALLSPQVFSQATIGSTGTAQKTVSLSVLRGLKVPKLELSEQKRMAAKLSALEGETQRLASLYECKLAALDELKESLLHQAFAGEL